jgi:UDP-N-acetylglucosamine 2-epimerase
MFVLEKVVVSSAVNRAASANPYGDDHAAERIVKALVE